MFLHSSKRREAATPVKLNFRRCRHTATLSTSRLSHHQSMFNKEGRTEEDLVRAMAQFCGSPEAAREWMATSRALVQNAIIIGVNCLTS
jgi:hypothetical protein